MGTLESIHTLGVQDLVEWTSSCTGNVTSPPCYTKFAT